MCLWQHLYHRSSQDVIEVDICSKCHPFFTGEMKFVDTMGRVEKFHQKQVAGQAQAHVLAEKKKKKLEKIQAQEHAPKSLKEMLMGMK